MKKMKKINKQLRSNLITYGIVVAAYIIVTLCMQAGMISSLLQGLLVPLCVYVILAISLNLTVGILGELSLGHAGFMCAGACLLYTSVLAAVYPVQEQLTKETGGTAVSDGSTLEVHYLDIGQGDCTLIPVSNTHLDVYKRQDEPTGNLDSRNSQEIMELLKLSNKKYSQTLVMITHDENLALQADRIIAIKDGRIARDEVIRR